MKGKRKNYKIILITVLLASVLVLVLRFFFQGEKNGILKSEAPNEKLQISIQNIEAIQFGGIIVDASEMDV